MNSSLNPGKIAERLQEKTELEKKVIKELAEGIFEIAARELRNEDAFSIFGFGNFKRILVPASTARNPQTGEEIDVPEHYRVKFTPAGKTAERINAEFAHLKPRILEDDEIPEGLLVKAERYNSSEGGDGGNSEPEWFEDSGEKNSEKSGGKSEEAPVEDSETEISNALWDEETSDDGFASPELTVPGFEERRSGGKRMGLAIVILLVLVGIGGWLLFGRTGTKKTSEPLLVEKMEKKPAEKKKEIKKSAAETNKAEAKESRPSPKKEGSLPVTPYQVRYGETFSALTIKKWGALALWPYLYVENMGLYPDPDVVKAGDRIRLPSRPDSSVFQEDIQNSILSTYRRYKELINTEPGNARNPERRLSAGYVLIGGEGLYPGFMDKHSNQISTEDRKFAESLRR